MNRTVWITGASSGIGRALALRFAAGGDRVIVSARDSAALTALAEDASVGGRIDPRPLDVTDQEAVAATCRAIDEDGGPIDITVFNAGTHIPMGAADFSPDTVRRLMAVNVFGVANGLAAVMPRMMDRRAGHIAIVSSVAGYRGLPTAAAYGATKAALINMAESLKPELDQHGVRLSLINPGFVRTPLTDRNPFPMPFLIEADKAAERIERGLNAGAFEITFPRRFTWMLKMARCLPYALYFPIVRRMTQR